MSSLESLPALEMSARKDASSKQWLLKLSSAMRDEHNSATTAQETRKRKALLSSTDSATQAAKRAHLDSFEFPDALIKVEPSSNSYTAYPSLPGSSLASGLTSSDETQRDTGHDQHDSRPVFPPESNREYGDEIHVHGLPADTRKRSSYSAQPSGEPRKRGGRRRLTQSWTNKPRHPSRATGLVTPTLSQLAEQGLTVGKMGPETDRITYLDFLTRLRPDDPVVAVTANALLRHELATSSWSPEVLFRSRVEDLLRELQARNITELQTRALRPVLQHAEQACVVAWLSQIFQHDMVVLENACQTVLGQCPSN